MEQLRRTLEAATTQIDYAVAEDFLGDAVDHVEIASRIIIRAIEEAKATIRRDEREGVRART